MFTLHRVCVSTIDEARAVPHGAAHDALIEAPTNHTSKSEYSEERTTDEVEPVPGRMICVTHA